MSGVLTLLAGGSTPGIVGLGFGSGAPVVDTSVYYRVLLAVQAKLQSLGLAGVSDASIVVQKLPVDRHLGSATGLALPAIIVSPDRERMDPRAGTNLLDDVVYAVRVTIFDRDNQEPTGVAHLDRYLRWREQIARAFRNQRLTAVSEIHTASTEPGDFVDAAAWAKNLFVSTLILRFVSREPRGT